MYMDSTKNAVEVSTVTVTQFSFVLMYIRGLTCKHFYHNEHARIGILFHC